jgi:uncharacterized hydrophobic protein (TIGR00271 family)
MKKKLGEYISQYFSLTYDNASYDVIRERILSGGQVRGANFCVLILAIFVASIGLNMNSTAVIIGAMLISPLMGGIMATGYCIATNDIKSALQYLVKLVLQVIISLVTSFIYFTISPISTAHSELLARTNPTIWDVLIAFFGGLAGIIGTTRQEKSNVLPGVAIATALMPPLCTAGYGLSIHSLEFFGGAMYLFFINSFFICLSTIIVLKIMHVPEYRVLSRRARKRVHIQLGLIACITVMPSIYLAYQTTETSILESRVSSYISECFSFPNTEVIQTNIDSENNTIDVALLGQTIDNQTIEELSKKLSDYKLESMSLKVTQTQTSSDTDNEKLKELIQSLINNNVDIASFKEFMYKTETLEKNVQDDTISVTDTASTDFSRLSQAIQTLYPTVDGCYIGYVDGYSNSGLTKQDTILVLIQTSVKLPQTDYDRLNAWIQVELDTEDYILIEDTIATETSTETAETPLEETTTQSATDTSETTQDVSEIPTT